MLQSNPETRPRIEEVFVRTSLVLSEQEYNEAGPGKDITNSLLKTVLENMFVTEILKGYSYCLSLTVGLQQRHNHSLLFSMHMCLEGSGK